MDIDTVLVPVDGSEESVRAIEVAVAVAERYGAQVHALYVLDRDQRERTERMMDAARDLAADVPLTHSVAYGFSTSHLTIHPGSVVLDASEDAGADFLVIPREGPADLLGKAAGYVLQFAKQPVLAV
ncbi:universal stress protein [Halomarina halobia]|uniref:Universal stress protein n=1 Tax=Halomarina halobia TaxID=3033386 RepID=A0ABD6AAW8_9EURY|nr:universal stress protein [Halomarina sp. PSR21]